MGKTILIAEDELPLLGALKEKIDSLGYTTLTAEDGEEALKVLESNKVDLILLDILMPKKNGFEVLEAIRKNPTYQKLPVIILTNLDNGKDIERGNNLGACDFIVKSNISIAELMNKVKKILGE
jgi:DNA-binding response OmpR family regulator